MSSLTQAQHSSMKSEATAAWCPDDTCDQILSHASVGLINPLVWALFVQLANHLGPVVWKMILDWLNKTPTPAAP